MTIRATRRLHSMRGDLTLGKAIKSIRLGEEAKQSDFADKLGVTQSYLSDIECDRKEVSPQKACELAKKLGYSKKQFIRLAIQDSLRRKGLHYEIELREAA